MNRKQELKAKKDAEIFKDFCRMYNDEGMRPDAIYERLEVKYFLDPTTLQRIVSKQAKQDKVVNQVEGIP